MRAIGPTAFSVRISSKHGPRATRPWVGLIPAIPQKAAGMRIDPPMSVPSASGARPAATAAPEPPLDPPGVRSSRRGLRVTPNSSLEVWPHSQNGGFVVFAITIAPASRRRRTATASHLGTKSASTRVPIVAGAPRTQITSLTATGTPHRAPPPTPAASRLSAARAAASASSASTTVQAFTVGSTRSIRSSAARTSSSGPSARLLTAAAIATASRSP